MSLVRVDRTDCVTHCIFSVEVVDSVPGVFSSDSEEVPQPFYAYSGSTYFTQWF